MTEPSTETRDWAEVRKAAVHAVLQAASDYGHDGLVAGDAEKLADAVLAVCDEEAINRMADEFVAESRLISLGAEDGKATLKAAPAREIVAHWVMASRGLLADAKNYVEIEMEFPDRPNSTRYAFVLQRVGKFTPHQMRKQAEQLVEEALHLRMYGELAPGSYDTWAEWDQRAEAYLRDVSATPGSESAS